jgi:uncharacterized protein YbjT (DUF2867 family)
MPNGADPTGRSRLAFARYKGQAENALLAAGFPRVYIFRPRISTPWNREGNRISATAYCAGSTPRFASKQVIRADNLGRAMVDLAFSETGKSRSVVL